MDVFWVVLSLSAFDLFTGGIFYMLNSGDVDINYVSELKRYESGELWWWQVRNDERSFIKKLHHCSEKYSDGDSSLTSYLCKVEASKTVLNYYILSYAKVALCFLQTNSNLLISSIIICSFGLTLAYIIDRRIYCLGKLKKKPAREFDEVATESKNVSCENYDIVLKEAATVHGDKDMTGAFSGEPAVRVDDSNSQTKVKLMRKSMPCQRNEVPKGRDYYLPKRNTNVQF